jgi:hypothetical protein
MLLANTLRNWRERSGATALRQPPEPGVGLDAACLSAVISAPLRIEEWEVSSAGHATRGSAGFQWSIRENV